MIGRDIQCHINVADTVLGHRMQGLAIHLRAGHQDLLQRLGQSLFHPFGGSAGIDGRHQSLLDGNGGKLRLVHLPDTQQADHNQARHHQIDGFGAFYDSLKEITGLSHRASSTTSGITFIPVDTFWLPSTMIRSPGSTPLSMATPVPAKLPADTERFSTRLSALTTQM